MLLWTFYSLMHFWNDHKFQSSRLLSPFHMCACMDTHASLHMLSPGFYKWLASGLRPEERLTAPFSTVFPSQFHRDSHNHIKQAKNIKMLELIPYGLFRWHQIPSYSQRDIWVKPNNQRSSSEYTYKNQWSSSYCSTVSTAFPCFHSRVGPGMMPALLRFWWSGQAVLVPQWEILLLPVLLSSCGAGQIVANRGAGIWDALQH